MPDFKLVAPFEPTGDQPAAIERLTDGLAKGVQPPGPARRHRHRQDATLAWTIAQHNKPTLVLAHNKTLAAQLYAEFREFFPENAVEYFVSYFDYYQPEAYLPRSDTYIEKDSSRNDEIDRLRHAATHALFERRDVIIVASVSLHLRPRRPGRLRRDRAQAADRRPVPARRRPAPPRRPPVPAQRPGADAAPGSASAATRSSSSRRPRRRSSGSSSSATRSSGSPSSTR